MQSTAKASAATAQSINLLDLPEELISLILSFMSPEALIITVPLVCKQLRALSNDLSLWQMKYNLAFGQKPDAYTDVPELKSTIFQACCIAPALEQLSTLMRGIRISDVDRNLFRAARETKVIVLGDASEQFMQALSEKYGEGTLVLEGVSRAIIYREKVKLSLVYSLYAGKYNHNLAYKIQEDQDMLQNSVIICPKNSADLADYKGFLSSSARDKKVIIALLPISTLTAEKICATYPQLVENSSIVIADFKALRKSTMATVVQDIMLLYEEIFSTIIADIADIADNADNADNADISDNEISVVPAVLQDDTDAKIERKSAWGKICGIQ